MSTAIENPHLASALHKSKTKLLPLIVLMFALAMLDRSNVGFVKTFLETDAGIGAAAYALGAGIFFNIISVSFDDIHSIYPLLNRFIFKKLL